MNRLFFSPRLTFLWVTLLTGSLALSAQAEKESPYKVNGPVTKADPTFWDTPFLWIGLVVLLIGIFVLVFNRRQSGVRNRLHKY